MAEETLCNNLLVGVCGSIHALHIPTYLLLFRESLATNIRVIMTASAGRMLREDPIALYADAPVFTDLWQHSAEIDRAPHIQLTRWADLFVVVPATANVLGKAANGIADDLLSTAILGYTGPVVFAPAMNPTMWASRAVQRNVRTLAADGHYIVPPEAGTSITSGNWDLGLGPSPETILPHLKHVRMKALKNEYWDEATRDKPLSPAQRKLQALGATRMPVPVESTL
jgi:phosphopantothenoylcysteine decarboxylase/phosphopantothenate--cysteine ligase